MKSLAIVALVIALWLAGLMAFADRAARSTPADDPPMTDGVVVLTGASSARIDAAVRLLEEGKAKRLLVSGVNRDVTRDELKEVTRAVGRIYDCCVDLGFRAENTRGNARETASWARYYKFKTLLVVTADYHMPRSILELRAELPDVTFHPYPVATDTVRVRSWWRRGGDARRLMVEYTKYLVILGREAILGLGERRPTAEEAAG
jgi:uncharacterized SAM-binding protein YcdF (DUF218 family)